MYIFIGFWRSIEGEEKLRFQYLYYSIPIFEHTHIHVYTYARTHTHVHKHIYICILLLINYIFGVIFMKFQSLKFSPLDILLIMEECVQFLTDTSWNHRLIAFSLYSICACIFIYIHIKILDIYSYKCMYMQI